MKRKSIKLSDKHWEALDDIAKQNNVTWSGKPSWRKLLRLMAAGHLKLK